MDISIFILALAAAAALFAFMSWSRKTDGGRDASELRELKALAQRIRDDVLRVEGGLKTFGDIPKSVEERADRMREETTGALAGMRQGMETKFDTLQKHVRDTMSGALEKIDMLAAQNSQNAEKLKESVDTKLELVRNNTGESITVFRKESSESLNKMREETTGALAGMRQGMEAKFDVLQKQVQETMGGALEKIDALAAQNSQNAEKLKESVDTKLELVRNNTGESITVFRKESSESLNKMREETTGALAGMRQGMEAKFDVLQKQVQETMGGALEKIDALASQNSQNAEKLKESVDIKLELVRNNTNESITVFRKESSEKLDKMHLGLEANLRGIRESNEKKLDQMRETVDEKLQKTLQERLNQTFGTVSEQLKNVHQELGKMQSLTDSMGDLKRVLAGAPTRGAIGEVKLEEIIRDVLSPAQYDKNAQMAPQSQERVEFAIHIPYADGEHRLLPVDSKFPLDDYERYVEAMENADKENVRRYRHRIVQNIRTMAGTIREKYINPPYSTEFAVMFLPTEGLYSVVAGEPGLLSNLQLDYQVRVTGPHNFHDMLSTIRAGLHLFSVGQRSREVWRVLSEVKTEFGKFGDMLESAKKSFNLGMNKLEDLSGRRTRQMDRVLGAVDALPGPEASGPSALTPPVNPEG